ncbi:MAG TPA: MMPL family transporter [Terracidiphilus sp.]|nr:MMPL family transporter [Terracidiphilus sp.]
MSLLRSRNLWASAGVLACVLALLPFSFHSERHLETATRVEGSDAQKVVDELTTRFHSPFVDQVVLVVQGLPSPDTDPGAQALTALVDGLKDQPGVSGIVSYLDLHDTLFLGSGGGTYIVIGLASVDGSAESFVPGLTAQEKILAAQLRLRYPAVRLELTGETPLNFDIRKASADEVHHSEGLVIPLTLALLMLAFGSIVAALIPLAVGQLAIATTLAIAALLAARFHLSILVQNLATMLGLGLGIDYTLLMVSRFREAIAAGLDGPAAAAQAAKRAGRTLVVSASTVAIGFVALLTVPISEIRSIGVAGCLVAASSVLLANTVVPALLGLLGKRIDAGRLPFRPQMDARTSQTAGARWRRWGQIVVRHPWLAIVLSGAPLLALGWQATQLDTSLPKGNWLPQKAESVQALHALEKMDRAGIVQSLRIIIELPQEDSVSGSDEGWTAIDRASKALASDPRCARVISLPMLAGSDRANLTNLSRETKRTFLSADGHAALLEVLPKSSLSLRAQVEWMRSLRRLGATSLTGVSSATMLVGGIPALNGDYQTIISERFLGVMALVVVGTLFALFAGFRSIVVAIKAIMLNLLSVAASFGVLVLVYQKGYGSGVLGAPGGTGSVFPLVPIVTFAIVFGLSMDYEVFLVTRVLEARRGGLNEDEAICEAMARTSGLITSAASIMIVIFVAFTLGEFLVIKMIGLTLSVAVLIDATLVRMVLGPALLCLAGDWNWWPNGLTKKNRNSSTQASTS